MPGPAGLTGCAGTTSARRSMIRPMDESDPLGRPEEPGGAPQDFHRPGNAHSRDDSEDPAGAPSADDMPPVVLPVEDALDLHAFSPRDIPDVVLAYLEEAARAGLREVRLIHGKGIGVQRERIRRILAQHPGVARFEDAPAERGHWGATIVHLREPSQEDPR